MPLKIRCPHCRRVLRAADDTIGEQRLCPTCGQAFTVPIPEREAAASATGAPRQCVQCKYELAPTATHCPRCLTDQLTGKHLPYAERLRRGSRRTWAATLGVLLLIVAAIVVPIVIYLRNHRPPPPRFEPVAKTAGIDEQLARRVLAAGGPALVERLKKHEPAPLSADDLAKLLDTAKRFAPARRT